MTTATKTVGTTHGNTDADCGQTLPWSSISEPGCYVCNWSGHLLRVPDDAIAPGRSPLINMVACEPLFVTKISNNPFVSVTKAKLLACNADVHVNF